MQKNFFMLLHNASAHCRLADWDKAASVECVTFVTSRNIWAVSRTHSDTRWHIQTHEHTVDNRKWTTRVSSSVTQIMLTTETRVSYVLHTSAFSGYIITQLCSIFIVNYPTWNANACLENIHKCTWIDKSFASNQIHLISGIKTLSRFKNLDLSTK